MSAHLEDDIIIGFLDGELSEEEKEKTSRHLENCWSCRGNLKIIQDSIDNFMNQRQEILISKDLPPSEPALWLFQKRLRKFQSSTKPAKIPIWNRCLEAIQDIKTPLRWVIAGLVILLIASLLFIRFPNQSVSAAELLKRAEAAEFATDKVVRRKIVLQTKPLDPTEEKFVRIFDVWIDPFQKVKLQRVYLEDGKLLVITKFSNNQVTTYVPKTKVPSKPITTQIPGKLLKIMSAWEHGLTVQDFEDLIGDVSKTKVEEQQNLYLIDYREAEGVMKAVLVLDKQTLRPVKLSLEHKFNGDIFSYDFAETEFEAFEPDAVNKNAFEINADFIEAMSKAVK